MQAPQHAGLEVRGKGAPAQGPLSPAHNPASNHKSCGEEDTGFMASFHTLRAHMEHTACIYIGLFSTN